MRPASAYVVCLLLTLATLGLRFTGIGFGVPIWEEPDPDIPGHVDMVRDGWTPAAVEAPDEQYPHLVADLARWLPSRPPTSGADAPKTLAEHLDAAAWTYVQVRSIVAGFAVLLVPLVFLLARRFVRDEWALFAAALIACSLLNQSFAQQARPHAVAATLMTLALVCDLALVRNGTWRAYLWAGLASAAALASLHSAVAVLLAGLAAHLLRSGGARWFDRKLWVPVGLCGLAVPLFYPFLFEHVGQARDVEGGEVRLAEHTVSLAQFYGRGFRVIALSMWNYEPVATLLLALAGALWIARRVASRGVKTTKIEAAGARRELWVVLAFALPYVLAIGLFERTYERFLLPVLPCAVVFAAWGMQELARRIGPRVVGVLAVFSLIVPAAATAKLAWLRTQPDTLTETARWLAARPDAEKERVYLSPVAPALDLPLARRAEGLLLHGKTPGLPLSPWSAWQTRVDDEHRPTPTYDLRWLTSPRGPAGAPDLGSHLQSLAPALFVIEVYEMRTNHPALVKLREELRARGTPLARFGPDSDPQSTELELFYQLSDHFNDDEPFAWPHFTRRLLAARAIGPVVEVWSIP